MSFVKTIRYLSLLGGILLGSAVVHAQDGRVEVAGFGGSQWIGGGVGFNPYAGGSGALRVTSHLRILAEVGYTPLSSINGQVSSAASSITGLNVAAKTKLYDFNFGVDYGFGGSKTFVPYIVATGGVGHLSVSATVTESGESASGTEGSDSVCVSFGGGVRMYAGRHWGFKPEFRFVRYGGNLASNAAVFSGGVFFEFGK
jgi:hypothetical protein